jgi:UDP-glucose:(heptosyl)LPS alpha-1,3-glucosyltransferase
MKIAMSSRIYTKNGGIGRYVAELAEHFADEHEVHVFSSKWEDVGNENIIFHKTPLPPGPLIFEAGAYFLEMSALSKLMRSGFDIIHTEGLESAWLDVVTAHSIHRGALEAMKNIGELRPLGLMDKFLLTIEKLNYSKYRNYRKIIADATSGKRELMKYYNVPDEDIEVIPLGVDLDEFKPNLPDTFLKKTYNISDDDVVLIIVATEFYRKGMVELIESMRIICNEGYKNIKLLIVGKARVEGARKDDSFYRELVKKYGLEKNVIFTGSKTNSNNMELTKHYNLADIFVFPTKYEGFGIPTVEAMACELPVIVGPSGAGEDLIENGKNGFLIDDVNNPQEIADKILILAEDEKLMKKLGKAARTTAHICSWDNIANRTLKLYEEVLRY